MEIEEKLEKMRVLREKYPKLNLIDRCGYLVNVIFSEGANDKKLDEYFKELGDILEKVK
jgi:hypothetical protein